MLRRNSPLAKVLIAGSPKVGKTSLVNSFLFNDFFEAAPTIGVNFAQKVCRGIAGSLTLSLWDLSGDSRFRFIMPQLCSGAIGVILVFNSSNPVSLKEADEWLNLISKFANPSYQHAIVLVDNKSDKPATIPQSDVTAFCDKHNVANYIQCSAKTGENVSSVFVSICTAIQLNASERTTAAPLLHTKSY